MSLWTNITAEEATHGETNASWEAKHVEIDSRKIKEGDLFVAIKGENFDGHKFVSEALARGAVAAMVSDTSGLTDDASVLVVEDTMKALEDLARYARNRTQAKIIGVTGSVGKTSTKEMLRLALSVHGKTYASHGNFNNHIGAPLNLANLPKDADFGVFEMGMNHAGEISHLTTMVKPHVAIITCVDAVHLEFFDSTESIADAKAEIFEGVQEGGCAILHADSKHLSRLKMAAARNQISDVFTFGEAMDADVRLISYQSTKTGCNADATIAGDLVNFDLLAIGRHWAQVALITLATIHALGLDYKKPATLLAKFDEPDGRGKLARISLADGGEVMVIDDSYNASPASMRSAFAKTTEAWQAHGAKGKKIAALGDMLELGHEAPTLHKALAGELENYEFHKVYTAGSLMKHLHKVLPEPMRGAHVDDVDQLAALLLSDLADGDVLLIKGSHGSRIYQTARALLAVNTEENKHAV